MVAPIIAGVDYSIDVYQQDLLRAYLDGFHPAGGYFTDISYSDKACINQRFHLRQSLEPKCLVLELDWLGP